MKSSLTRLLKWQTLFQNNSFYNTMLMIKIAFLNVFFSPLTSHFLHLLSASKLQLNIRKKQRKAKYTLHLLYCSNKYTICTKQIFLVGKLKMTALIGSRFFFSLMPPDVNQMLLKKFSMCSSYLQNSINILSKLTKLKPLHNCATKIDFDNEIFILPI